MAIVKNKAEGPSAFTDQKFCSPNRTNAGEPNSSLTPEFGGEIVLDTTNNCLWKAIGITNTSWVALTSPN
jgi:hypothetical protein